MQHLQSLYGESGWRRENADLFKSDAALQWWKRPPEITRELVERDALVYHSGKWHATEQMRPVVLDIIKRQSLAALCGTVDALSTDRMAA